MKTPRLGFIVSPAGQKGGGMGRVKDYILQSGGDRDGRVVFQALDTRGDGSAMASIWKLAQALSKIFVTVLKKNLAFVHINMGDRGSVARKGIVVLWARLLGAKVVLHLHAAELVAHYDKAGPLVRWLIRQPFRAATCCVVIGRVWQDWLVRDLGIDSKKIDVVYNGVPVDPVVRGAVPIKKRILFLGNLMERKGVSDLLHAFALLPKTGWEATLAGGGDVDHYRALVKALKLTEQVTFTGWVDQNTARNLLQSHQILILPSYDEGLPLVILEGLGSGMAVMATAVGSIPEVLDDRRTILFVKAGDTADIAAKIQLLLSDEVLLKKLSDEGLRLYRERFTLNVFIENLFAVYRRHCGVMIERAE